MKKLVHQRSAHSLLAAKTITLSSALVFMSHALNAAAASANTSIEAMEEASVETISITGTRTARQINEIASAVTHITSQDIDATSASNIKDMLRYEPGVSVEGNGRYGLSGFNIRGINGDRVLITLDGVPIADEFSFGPNLSSRRDFIDIDLIQSVDIVRGPASTLYGSDAIGGVVAFTSKDPIDLLDNTQSFAGRFKSHYVSQANEWSNSAMIAGGSETWQWLLNASHRTSDEVESYYSSGDEFGDTRQQSDPQDSRSSSFLAKLIYQANESHRAELSIDGLDQSANTQLLSEQGTVSRGVLIQSSKGDDERERIRVSVDYTYQAPQANAPLNLKRISAKSFYQQSNSTQVTHSLRQTLSTQSLASRVRNSEFDQDVKGLNVQFDHEFGSNDQDGLNGINHYLIYGVSYEQTDSIALREGATTSVDSGANIPEFSVFPARDFPPSTLSEYAFYIQDEISLLNKSLTLSPGIRFDKFKLDATPDALFSNANPGVSVEDFSDQQLSSKLGVVYQITDSASIWYQYAEGFRIPPMDDINVGFTNFAGGYTSLPNADLLPETVVSNEVGIRFYDDAYEFSISAYNNQYDDFIESLAVKGFNPLTNLLEFQARNIDEVEISGIDLQVTWFIGESVSALKNWTARASYSHQDSEDKASGEELDSILPSQAVMGLSYGDLDSAWRAELAVTHTAKANQAASDDVAFFRADSYTLIDVLAHYQISDSVKINLGLFNLLDKEYYLASEVRGRTVEENLARFSSPGRNASINLIVNF
ncbi:TonB-dependent hemoglobin/transferrin/lactoferrin family receptor [Glaciecola sp. KUL10]|uniref:TonB-dependent hemoglobin/transferrin/lactoferrin family receptor n=1 Tax=Glaciecola sp. (strain KUL10) TaxID=2161813 RepID=UPI000D9E4B07|nr:TonB-dependent hemoglobin/transferrin/lactoferrin family receptor [Glaciecola sp. KUL10]GBL04455.1 iron complex outermembrane recepter protein [Glaciecola sp. KUL10]